MPHSNVPIVRSTMQPIQSTDQCNWSLWQPSLLCSSPIGRELWRISPAHKTTIVVTTGTDNIKWMSQFTRQKPIGKITKFQAYFIPLHLVICIFYFYFIYIVPHFTFYNDYVYFYLHNIFIG